MSRVPAWAAHRVHIVYVLAAIGVWCLVGAQSADAAPTIGGGNCWQPGAPRQCRTNWVQGQVVNVRLIDEYSAYTNRWGEAVNKAMQAWNDGNYVGTTHPGPVRMSWSEQPNDTWVFIKYSHRGEYPLNDQGGPVGATVLNCPSEGTGACSDRARPMNVQYSVIYVDRAEFDPAFGGVAKKSVLQTVFAHEIGHALGLFHSPPGTTSVMTVGQRDKNGQFMPGQPGPTIGDIGTHPPCGDALLAGVICVYNWGSE